MDLKANLAEILLQLQDRTGKYETEIVWGDEEGEDQMKMHRWYVIARWPTDPEDWKIAAGPFGTHPEVIQAFLERTQALHGMDVTVADVIFPAEYSAAMKEKVKGA